MSWSQLTKSIILQRGRANNHQPAMWRSWSTDQLKIASRCCSYCSPRFLSRCRECSARQSSSAFWPQNLGKKWLGELTQGWGKFEVLQLDVYIVWYFVCFIFIWCLVLIQWFIMVSGSDSLGGGLPIFLAGFWKLRKHLYIQLQYIYIYISLMITNHFFVCYGRYSPAVDSCCALLSSTMVHPHQWQAHRYSVKFLNVNYHDILRIVRWCCGNYEIFVGFV